MAYPGSHFKNFTAQEVSFSIRGKENLYYAAIRNGYFLPKFSASIITEDYITDVVLEKLYCPKFKDIRLAPCPFPPSKQQLLDYCKDIKCPDNKQLGIFEKGHSPDKQWLLALLSTHKETLRIFSKSYVPPPRNVKIDEKPIVSLPDDFVQGLPASKKKNKGIRLGLLSTSKA